MLAAMLGACTALPPLDGRTVSTALPPTTDTPLGRALRPLVQAHDGAHSGILALRRGHDAYAARALLADAAQRALDVQYYIWHADTSGLLLFEALRRAAARGVRVRLLLDDNNTGGMDRLLAALDAHPNIELRLFNPFMHRRWRTLDYLSDFARLNRRMHNKSFTADNQTTIIGGRNIGDEYFDAAQDLLFVDLDVLAVGPVVQDVSRDFDRYWASASAYPADRVLMPADNAADEERAMRLALAEGTPAAQAYLQAVRQSPFVQGLVTGRLPFVWAPTTMLSDDPAKGLGAASDNTLLWPQLVRSLGRPGHELHLVSPYFVPGAQGTAQLTAMAREDIEIAVLTNSLEATDVAVVHAGYAKRRKPLLRAGIALHEMKRSVGTRRGDDRKLAASSSSSLHAKTLSVDRERLFIGSFNFDPRSARLNTENGFVIDSPEMASAVADAFRLRVPELAYRVSLRPDGGLQWIARHDGQSQVHLDEPGTSWWLRLGVWLVSRLPIDWML